MLENRQKMVINSDTLISVGLLFFYLAVARNGDLSGKVTLSLIVYGGCLLIALTGSRMKYKYIRLEKFIWCISLIPFIYSSPFLLDAALYAIAILFIVFLEYKTADLKKMYGLILFVAIVNAVCIFIQFVDRSFFDNFAQVWYPEGMYQQYLRTLRYDNYLNGCNAIAGDTGGYLIYGIGLICVSFLIRIDYKQKIRDSIFFILLLTALFFTGKRSVALCGIAAVIIIYIVSARTSKKIQRILYVVLIIIAIVPVIDVIAELFPNANTITRIAESISMFNSGEDISSGRTRLYAYAWNQFKTEPLLGIGWKQFNRLTTDLYNYSSAHYVNNDYLQVLSETGIVGFICIYLPMVLFLIKSLKMCSSVVHSEVNNSVKMSFVYSLFIQLFYLTYSMFEIPLYDRCFFFMYILAVSIGYCAQREYKGQR